ncbi:hypothetical protein [Clostridium cellulovorans]|uniref:Uncharacterized protein n=1 Tax=Clostridium cellulovorans (strain ATCC 35296 / DSM 3052 / OCM 3 / 743B) TaxID=573061 RepID=D9SX27_CLOC7|nr:hypothetical protein [Clostridium cellulovorans]ADL51388.1 hypothetical protein Clocel_1642 [Clostridium cellulovorans 743B]
MDINKITFESVSAKIVECFNLGNPLKGPDLVPNKLGDAFEESRKNLIWEKVLDWELFESGVIDISDEDFIQLLFNGKCTKSGLLYIITDFCFSDKMAFCISHSDLEEFITTEYPKLCQMSFFQTEDIIFFKPNEKFITYLHHSGFIAHYSEKS